MKFNKMVYIVCNPFIFNTKMNMSTRSSWPLSCKCDDLMHFILGCACWIFFRLQIKQYLLNILTTSFVMPNIFLLTTRHFLIPQHDLVQLNGLYSKHQKNSQLGILGHCNYVLHSSALSFVIYITHSQQY